jgi:hypothetical protein
LAKFVGVQYKVWKRRLNKTGCAINSHWKGIPGLMLVA